MRLIKRLIELAFVLLIISLFMKNKDVMVPVDYFGLAQPITFAFWELVTLCVSGGIIIAAVGDFITQFKWIRERNRMMKTAAEHVHVVEDLHRQIQQLESESQMLKKDLEEKTELLESIRPKRDAMPLAVPGGLTPQKDSDKEPPLEQGKLGD